MSESALCQSTSTAQEDRLPDNQCEICGRCFARAEHLARHRRIHTSERPFDCPYCDAKFPRVDVKEKHIRRFHTEEGIKTSTLRRDHSARLSRAKLACDECRKKKLRCDNNHPCRTCQRKQLQCIVSESNRGPGRPRNEDKLTAPTHDIHGTDVYSMTDPVSAQASLTFIPDAETFDTCAVTDTSMPSLHREDLEVNVLSTVGSEPLRGQPQPTLPQSSSYVGAHIMGQEQYGWDNFDYMDVAYDFPPLEIEDWLGEAIDYQTTNISGDFWGDNILESETDGHSQTDVAIKIMISHFQRRSRAPSPCEREVRRSWYSAPPCLQMYDAEVINILLNMARTHLSSTFKIFSTFEATSTTSGQLCLAMASIGSLFSEVEGKIAVAKALYNDARRLHMDTILSREEPSFQSSLMSVKTFLLLEIYGICSGDKRSYEFLEAFHYDALRTFKTCWQLAPSDIDSVRMNEMSLLSEALHILDCYRALVLQRPPCFLHLPEPSAVVTGGVDESAAELMSLMTPTGPSITSSRSMRNIAVASAYTWMSGCRVQEGSRMRRLWKPEFVELALERWLNAMREQSATSSAAPEFSQMLLYHLAYINLHSNLVLLQRHAHEVIKPSGEANQCGSTPPLAHHTTSSCFKVALWHATSMMRLIKDNVAIPSRSQSGTPEKTSYSEPPHLPYCIYFATLVVWYGEINYQDNAELSRDACIEIALQLLNKLRAAVSKVMSVALRELLSDGRKALAS